MRILLVVDNANGRGGGVTVCFQLAEQFEKLGHEVAIASLEGLTWELEPSEGRVMSHVDFLGTTSPVSAVWRLNRYLRQSPQFDVQHAIGTHASAVLSLASIVGGRRDQPGVRVGSEHIWRSALYGDLRHAQGRVLGSIYRFAYRRLDGIVCVSEALQLRASVLPGMLRVPCRYLPNPVASVGNPVATRRLTRDPIHEPLRLFAAGALNPQKDFATLVYAVSLIRRQRDCTLAIAGRGELQQELQALIRDLDLVDAVTLVGYQSDVQTLMRKSDVFVLSSRWEGAPLVLVEALSCGLPIVATDCPSGPAEILQGGRLGRLVPVGDAAALAEAVLQVVKDPPDPSILVREAQRYDPMRVAEEYLAFFNSLAK